MAQSFFFYDLETSGLNPSRDRIMQFAGMRTDLELQPIGDSVNLLVKMCDDTLPSPRAINVTKITPQATLQDGLSEAEFCKYLMSDIFTPDTIAVGYNSIRFDDEFMRYTFWRNFYDPYEWQWKDGRGRWDLLDVVRMTRALRPDGIIWPTTPEGKATNRLELITKQNGISHEHAHDALSDVEALVSVTQLIKAHQPQLYEYLFRMRDKRAVQKLVNLATPQPFVYSCGKYSSVNQKTSVVFPIAPASNGNILVYDLRYNLEELIAERAELTKSDPAKAKSYFPIVKELKYNRCPAIAPISVLEKQDAWQSIQLSRDLVMQNLEILTRHPEFAEHMRTQFEQTEEYPASPDAEASLYTGFIDSFDKRSCEVVRNAPAQELAVYHPEFHDDRLVQIFPRYKARNFAEALSNFEREAWEKYRLNRIKSQQNDFIKEIQELIANPDGVDQFMLSELQLWYQSLLPY